MNVIKSTVHTCFPNASHNFHRQAVSRVQVPAGVLKIPSPQGEGEKVKDMDKKKIERLYTLLERAEKEKDTETVVALRWAIFTLENME